MHEGSPDYPINELFLRRWSPYIYDSRPVEEEKLRSLFEAARWAPSSFNEQPWDFILGFQGEEGFEAIHSSLVEGNQGWTAGVPVLGISVARMAFEKNGKPNQHAFHDVGLAMGSLVAQAVDLGLAVHQMSGFSPSKAKELLEIPEGHEAVAAFAIGYPGDLEAADPEIAKRDAKRRPRRPQPEFLFKGKWGASL